MHLNGLVYFLFTHGSSQWVVLWGFLPPCKVVYASDALKRQALYCHLLILLYSWPIFSSLIATGHVGNVQIENLMSFIYPLLTITMVIVTVSLTWLGLPTLVLTILFFLSYQSMPAGRVISSLSHGIACIPLSSYGIISSPNDCVCTAYGVIVPTILSAPTIWTLQLL